MRGYNSPPTDPDLWAKDASDLGLSASEIEYRLFESRYEAKTNSRGGCYYSVQVDSQESGNYNQLWQATPIGKERHFAVDPSVPDKVADPIFGHRDRKFVLTLHRVAREMDFDVALTTPKLLYRIDFNRFDGKMPMTKAIRAALTSYSRFPEWFNA